MKKPRNTATVDFVTSILAVIPTDDYMKSAEIAGHTGLKEGLVQSALTKCAKEFPWLIQAKKSRGYKRCKSTEEMKEIFSAVEAGKSVFRQAQLLKIRKKWFGLDAKEQKPTSSPAKGPMDLYSLFAENKDISTIEFKDGTETIVMQRRNNPLAF